MLTGAARASASEKSSVSRLMNARSSRGVSPSAPPITLSARILTGEMNGMWMMICGSSSSLSTKPSLSSLRSYGLKTFRHCGARTGAEAGGLGLRGRAMRGHRSALCFVVRADAIDVDVGEQIVRRAIVYVAVELAALASEGAGVSHCHENPMVGDSASGGRERQSRGCWNRASAKWSGKRRRLVAAASHTLRLS